MPESGTRHLPAFLELLEEAGAWLMTRGIPQWPPGSNRAQQGLLLRWIDSGTLLVHSRNGRLLAGCIVTRTTHDAWASRPGNAAYLCKLVVARSAAATGVGSDLLRRAEAWARANDLDRLRLDCFAGNDRLREYYLEHGFVELECVAEHDYQVRLFEKRISTDTAAS